MEMKNRPDRILEELKEEERKKTRGRLKIFFGYAAGVGKTYAMLKAAHAAKRRGTDVVAGYIEPHARPKTAALVKGLEVLPTRKVTYHGMTLSEFDPDAAMQRSPELILVDELAHTNADGSRHTKRYKDIEELLNAGINVYTTVNVQHIESLNDTVAAITGVTVRERIPDTVFDQADQVELVDIEPQDLMERLRAGEVYSKEQAERAVENFFTVDNLTALREIALRRCADRVNHLSDLARARSHGDYYTGEHILVGLSSSPSNAKIIRTAARMAGAFRAEFTAVFVETSRFPEMSDEDVRRLRSNMHLARQLGATIETLYGDEIAEQIAEYARLSGVSKIVIGRSAATRRHRYGKATLTEQLIALAPNLDVHIIPDRMAQPGGYRPPKRYEKREFHLSKADVGKTALILALMSGVAWLFDRMGFAEANLITVYVLGVLVTAVVTEYRVYSIVASLLSVLLFNYLFTEPRYTFDVYSEGYPVTFAVMLTAAILTGTLADRLKRTAKQSARSAYRTKLLFDTNQLLQKEETKEGIIAATAKQLTRLFGRNIVFYPSVDGRPGEPIVFPAEGADNDEVDCSEHEKAVAAWVMKNNRRAGATTSTLSNAHCLYLAVRVKERIYGVVGIVMEYEPPDAFENSILLSILGECALALENERNAREKEEAAVLAKNEQTRANLLRAISHDLRTPLTAISGHAANLMEDADRFDEETRKSLYRDIYEDSMWLIQLVENLLAITRIEEGRMQLQLTTDLIDDAVDEALRHVARRKEGQTVTVEESDEVLTARMDPKLIVQVIINLVNNAILHTPEGTSITIGTRRVKGGTELTVSDDGPGIPDDEKGKIFDMFYSGANRIADSRRTLGMGLSLCRSIVAAHGGSLIVKDHVPHGTSFIMTLPDGEEPSFEKGGNGFGKTDGTDRGR